VEGYIKREASLGCTKREASSIWFGGKLHQERNIFDLVWWKVAPREKHLRSGLVVGCLKRKSFLICCGGRLHQERSIFRLHQERSIFDLVWWKVAPREKYLRSGLVEVCTKREAFLIWFGGRLHQERSIFDLVWWKVASREKHLRYTLVEGYIKKEASLGCTKREASSTWFGGRLHQKRSIFDLVWWKVTSREKHLQVAPRAKSLPSCLVEGYIKREASLGCTKREASSIWFGGRLHQKKSIFYLVWWKVTSREKHV
jgi:hypothetical protein